MQKTKFNKAHYRLKGKMVDFFGWDLPVQYSGLNEEHIAVRTKGGIFDVSHMGEIFFRGPQAREAVSYLTSNSLKRLKESKIQYNILTTENGCFVDDLLVYMLGEEEFLLVVNAANLDKDYAWMKEKAGHFDCDIINESEEWSQIAVQGPLSGDLLSQFTDIDLKSMAYYTFSKGKVGKFDAIVSRTGYTGEYGFEVYFKGEEEDSVDFFMNLAKEGEKIGVLPCGLGARDTLRLEAGMPLYGNDIDDEHNILEAGLNWVLKLKKANFIGKEALLKIKKEGIKRKLVAFELTGRGIARKGYNVFIDNEQKGVVTSGTFSPFLKKAIGMAYVPIENSNVGDEIFIEIRNKKVSAKIVELPFYKLK